MIASELSKLIHLRLGLLIKKRVDPKIRSHWCLKFTKENTSLIASLMAMQQHVKTIDLAKIAQKDACVSALEISLNMFQIMGGNEEPIEGFYLYFDKIRKESIRSGKVHKRTFKERMKDHETGSKLLTAGSKPTLFYLSYPKGKGGKGIQDCVFIYVAFGYNRIINPKVVELTHDFFKLDSVRCNFKKMNQKK